MKRVLSTILLAIAILSSAVPVNAQNGKSPFDADVPLLYLGIDFTQLRVINDASAIPSDVKNRHFFGINQLVTTEVKKFEWQKALEKTNYSVDLGLVTAKNEKVDETKIASTSTADETRLKKEDIEKLVAGYDFSGKKGFGLIVFMEAFSKTSESGTMWVTFVNMDTKKVVLTERMVGKTMGFGFRNYYSYSVYKVINEIKKNKLDQWRGK